MAGLVRSDMIQKNMDSLSMWFFDFFLKKKEIFHFVSTRTGGYSRSPYGSLNLGFHVGDGPDIVLKNREKLALETGIPLRSFVTVKQVHGNHVKVIKEKTQENSFVYHKEEIDEADAMVSDIKGICLVIFLADCVPIVFFDSFKKVIGLAHAGWKGTIQSIAKKPWRSLKRNSVVLPKI